MESHRHLAMTKKKKSVCSTENSSLYITVNGSVYEKMSNDSVDVSFDLQEDVYNKLSSLVKEGKFVSIGDAVRYILRRKLEDEGHKI